MADAAPCRPVHRNSDDRLVCGPTLHEVRASRWQVHSGDPSRLNYIERLRARLRLTRTKRQSVTRLHASFPVGSSSCMGYLAQLFYRFASYIVHVH